MKLIRYGEIGSEKPGVLDDAGAIRDLSSFIDDIDPKTVVPSAIDKLQKLDVNSLPLIEGDIRIGAPISGISKILAAGLNYTDHAAETKNPIPEEPIMFMKAVSSICGPNDNTITPKQSKKLDYEVELGIIIGTEGNNIEEEDALSHVAGYCLCNDVSERHFQVQRGGQWDKGKGADTFCPLGPWLVTPDEVGDVQNLNLFCNINGESRQNGNTSDMIFSVKTLISYFSIFMTLKPGDLIITGTPSGVGAGFKPGKWLNPGDKVHLGCEKLGEQRQTILPWPGH